MSVVLDILYGVGLLLALPVLLVKSWRTGKYRQDLGGRFGRYATPPLEPGELAENKSRRKRLMLHCVSVGELLSVRHLVDQLLERDGDVCVIITTTTDTGTARAREIYAAPRYAHRVQTFRYPLDFSFAVKAFLDRARPDLIALVELETWPNFIRLARRRGIPVVVINGRLTARSLRRYRLVRPVVAAMLRQLAWLGIQTETIAARFRALGAPAERIEVIPTIKYDSADLSDTIPGAERLAAACGIMAEHRLFVGGSTGPGEEEPLLGAYKALREQHPALRLAIAPRKPETVPGTLAAIRAAGLHPVLRTDRPDERPADAAQAPAWGRALGADEVLVLNTLGELKKLYSLGFASFVGRSLVPLGGSDMIEVAALAKPCCFGPHAHNFAEAVELLTGGNAALALAGGYELQTVLASWLASPEAAKAMGARAREVVAAQRGATGRYVEELCWRLARTPDCARTTC